MELCKVNNIINFYTVFSTATSYYLWQVMAKEFRSDTFAVMEREIGRVGRYFLFVSSLDRAWILWEGQKKTWESLFTPC